jgi:hypothetical protein
MFKAQAFMALTIVYTKYPNITNDFSGTSRSVTDNSRVMLQIVASLS